MLSALSSGFTPEQILNFLLKQFPKHSSKIKKAIASGFSAENIIKHLGGGRKALNQDIESMTENEQARGRDIQRRENVNKGALAAGTLAAGAALTPLASQVAGRALSRALPQGITSQLGSILPSTGSLTPNQGMQSSPQTLQQPQQQLPIEPSQQPPANQVAANISQPPNNQQPKVISDISNKLWESVEKGKLTDRDPSVSAFLKVASNLRKTRGLHSKEQFDKLYQAFENKRQMGLEGPELARELFAEYEQMKSPTNNQLPESNESVEKSRTIEKNSLVASPNGVGEVKEIRNGKALVDVDGKLHRVNEDELEGEPEDIAELYDNLFNAIPDEYKSRMMNYAGYDEESNELLFRPHGGAAYVYKDIPEEFANDLKNRLHKAKTTGKNMYGMWYEGDQSYGAGMSALIKKLQGVYGGKGKEYVRKYNTLFDILGVPHEAKRRKEEERRKRKRIS